MQFTTARLFILTPFVSFETMARPLHHWTDAVLPAGIEAPAQVRGLRLVCKLRFWGWGMGGGLLAAGAKMLAIFSVNHCILALKVMPHTL